MWEFQWHSIWRQLADRTEDKDLFAPLTTENVLHMVKRHFSGEIKKEIIDSYFSDKQNVKQLTKSVKRGQGIFGILNKIGEKIFGNAKQTINFEEIIDKVEIEKATKNTRKIKTKEEQEKLVEINLNREKINTIKKQAESLENIGIEELIKNKKNDKTRLKSDKTMYGNSYTAGNRTSTGQIQRFTRGLSLKDALDLIPRYNGNNITLLQFINGCEEATNILPIELEVELAKLIQIKLSGEA